MNDLARAEAAFIRPVPSSGHLAVPVSERGN